MPVMKHGHDDRDAGFSIDLSELDVLYSEESLRTLISRALEHLDRQLAALDAHVAACEYASAANALHQMKGTAAFFASDGRTIDALHAAEDAFRAADPSRSHATLPAAQQALASLRHALAVRAASK
jgi:HPt (histidine-containing phosphotransfer) domain-containing protein